MSQKIVLKYLVNDCCEDPSCDLNLNPACLYIGLPSKGSSIIRNYENCSACNCKKLFIPFPITICNYLWLYHKSYYISLFQKMA